MHLPWGTTHARKYSQRHAIATSMLNPFPKIEPDDAGAAIFGANAATEIEAGIQFKKNAPSSPEYAAKTILKNIKKKNKRILIGFDAHFYDLMSRLFPKSFLKIIWILPFLRNLFKSE